MPQDETGTYQQAKHLYLTAIPLKEYKVTVDPKHVGKLRKHLAEMIYRKKSSMLFTTRKLDKSQLLVVRIR